jgi:hypothetical protein
MMLAYKAVKDQAHAYVFCDEDNGLFGHDSLLSYYRSVVKDKTVHWSEQLRRRLVLEVLEKRNAQALSA